MPFTRAVTGENIVEKPLDEFPPVGFPVVFADGVMSAIRATPNVKLYLNRYDPHPFGQGGAVTVPIMQVVMPNNGFAPAVVFLVRTLATLAEEGHVGKEHLSTIIEVCKTALEKHGAA